MKGLSLPINVLVIVVIAIIVLLGVVAIYFGGFSPFSSAISVEGAKNGACSELVRKNCAVNPGAIVIQNFNANNDTSINPGAEPSLTTLTCNAGSDNLARLCACFYQRTNNVDCKRLCGCP